MTKEQCTGLALLLLEAAKWLDEVDPGNLDADLLRGACDAVMRIRHKLELEAQQ